MLLGEADLVSLLVSEQVIVETERALARKAPRALTYYREALRGSRILIVRDPSSQEIAGHEAIISDRTDVSIVVAAMRAAVDLLVTLNRRHFIDNPDVAVASGLRIGTPGDALAWVRSQLATDAE